MNGNQLSATTSAGQQGTTQSPQSANGGAFTPGQKSDSLQTGTPQTALEGGGSTQGVTLGGARPNVVELSNIPKTSTTTQTQTPVKEKHQTSPIGMVASVIFVGIALILIWSAINPVKNTTD